MDPNQSVTPNIPPPVQPQVPAEAPVLPQQSAQQPVGAAGAPQASAGRSKLMWIILAVVVLLLLAGGTYYYFAMAQNNANLSAYPSPTVIPTSTEATEAPTSTVTPIQSSSDLDGALNQVDSTDTSAGIGLDQNTQDSTTFTP